MAQFNNKFKLTVLSLALMTMAGCSTLGLKSKKDVEDLGPQSTDQVYFEKAERALNKGQYSEASKSLEAIKSYYPTGQYAEQAELNLIYTKFQQKDYESAINAADRFLQLYPQHDKLDYVYYVRGVANMEQNYDSLIRYTSLKQAHRDLGYLRLAYQNFKDLIIRYPSSEYAVDAAQRMTFIGHELAESEMNVARFNLKRKAWIAALERALWVIQYYPQTPLIPEAVATVAYSYQKLGQAENAQQYIQLLQANYPHLVKSNGDINLRAARNERSILNIATLGLFGDNARTVTLGDHTSTSEPRSLINKATFGLLGNTEQKTVQPKATDEKRSLINKLSFGLLNNKDKAE